MINSILTNAGAMEALQSLNATNQSLTNTQNQISSGLRVQTAKDDASAWTIATTMKANVASLNQVSTDLGNADSILGTAVSGATQISGLVSQIRAKVASYNDPSQNQAAIQSEVTQLGNQINDIVASSSFNGVNLLNGSTATGLTFLAATNNSYAGATPPTATTSPTIATGAEIDVSSANATTNTNVSNFFTQIGNLSSIVDATTLNTALQTIDNYNGVVEGQAAQFGAVQQNIEGQQTFINNLATSLTSGISNMVDANMTAESAQLSALQTQQQLGTQALAIANQTPQLLLKLFP
jgi:flagellin